MLEAGKLRQRITIQQQAISQDSQTGEQVTTWVDFRTSIPASIEPLSAREFIQASAVQSRITARIVIRYLSGITASMRILHGSDVYNIEGVLTDKVSGREYLTLPVSAGVNEGQ